MKKKFIMIFLIVVILMGMLLFFILKKYNVIEQNIYFNSGNSNWSESYNYSEEDYIMETVNNVTITIKEGTLTKNGATIVIVDRNKPSYTYGEWFRIDKKVNDIWVELKPKNENYIFNAIGYSPGDDEILELKTDWTELYGKLKKGKYRLVKEVGMKYIAIEFNID